MHTTGVKTFKHETTPRQLPLNPVKFSDSLINFRNSRVSDSGQLAEIVRIEVYRGLPSSVHDPIDNAANIEQMNSWIQDSRVDVVQRNLKYDLTPSVFPDGAPKRYNSKVEKGIDVLCALAIMRNSASENIDLVIVASHDSDLEPAIEEAHRTARRTKFETVSWFNPESKAGRSRMNPKTSSKIWNTALGREVFELSLDI